MSFSLRSWLGFFSNSDRPQSISSPVVLWSSFSSRVFSEVAIYAVTVGRQVIRLRNAFSSRLLLFSCFASTRALRRTWCHGWRGSCARLVRRFARSPIMNFESRQTLVLLSLFLPHFILFLGKILELGHRYLPISFSTTYFSKPFLSRSVYSIYSFSLYYINSFIIIYSKLKF